MRNTDRQHSQSDQAHGLPELDVAVAIIWDTNCERLLIARRPTDKHVGGMWEFPGGKRETGESIEDALRREIREELGIEITILRSRPVTLHRYEHRIVRLYPFDCLSGSVTPQPLASTELRWVTPDELRQLPLPPANAPLIVDIIAQPLRQPDVNAAEDQRTAIPNQ
ncbi:MAG: (deoxy)nucleoside triphosphate pyrophosphohydrolase [Phycisphaerae bacterium]